MVSAIIFRLRTLWQVRQSLEAGHLLRALARGRGQQAGVQQVGQGGQGCSAACGNPVEA